MPDDDFKYDVFLSHSSKDKAVVRPLAERLRADGLRVWYDDWEIQVGDNIPHKIEEGLEHSRILLLCMSAHAFGSDWAQLESQTFRFRDPLNQQRRFLPSASTTPSLKAPSRNSPTSTGSPEPANSPTPNSSNPAAQHLSN